MASVPACSVSPAARAPQEAGTLPLCSGIRHNAKSGGQAAVPYVPAAPRDSLTTRITAGPDIVPIFSQQAQKGDAAKELLA